MVRSEVLGTAVGIVLIGVADVFVDFVWFFGVWIRRMVTFVLYL